MPNKVRIALDAMGGDVGVPVVVPGAAISLKRHPETEFLMFGDSKLIAPELDKHPALKAASQIVHTDVAVRMDDKPSQALRRGRKTSSMWLAIDAVKRGEADTAVSAGNTGALMAMARFNLRTLAGRRPAGDRRASGRRCAASSSCSTSARRSAATRSTWRRSRSWAAAMARVLFDLERPTVGLLNIGVEEVKGIEEVREAGRTAAHAQSAAHGVHRFRRGRRHRRGRCRRDRHRRLYRQHRAEGRRRHGAADRRISAQRHEPDLALAARLSVRAQRLPGAARQDGSAQGQWRRVPRAERHRHQEPRRHRCGGLCLGGGHRLRHGPIRSPDQDQSDTQPRRRSAAARRRAFRRLSRDCYPFDRARLRLVPARAGRHQCRARCARSTRPTTGSCSAPAFASAISPPKASSPRISA